MWIIPVFRAISVKGFFLASAIIMMIAGCESASAQCLSNPTGETAVGLQNGSSYFLTFFIDNQNKGGVASGDKSIDFVVTPGTHGLRADAIIRGETVSASRVADIPEGYVCTWTVTDPPGKTAGKSGSINRDYRDSLGDKPSSKPNAEKANSELLLPLVPSRTRIK